AVPVRDVDAGCQARTGSACDAVTHHELLRGLLLRERGPLSPLDPARAAARARRRRRPRLITTGERMHRKTAVPVIVCLLVSCGGAASDEDSFVEHLPQLTLTEELRIGSVDDPDAGFSQIGGLTIGPDGNLYVIEQQDNEVRVYDAQGTLVRRFGRQGEGPGEFLFPSQLGVVGDTLWVTDLRLQRLSLFTTSGEF